MRAASLFLVFVLAKSAVLLGHALPWSFWTPIAYLWQDALVALGFAAFDAGWKRTGFRAAPVWIVYAALALYAAINIPVGRAVYTPLTWPMLRAAGGPLADSFAVYLTWTNAVLVLAALPAAALLPRLLRQASRRAGFTAAAAGIAMVALGPVAGPRVETRGLERNVVLALAARKSAPASPSAVPGDWRNSRFGQGRSEDLSSLRGLAKGRNVILVSLESTAAQYLPLYGAPYDVTPNLTALAANGVVFENAYAVYP